VISGVVLAAGEGRRFGGTKQIALLRGKPLAQHPIDALAAADLDEILVVTGHEAEIVEAALSLPHHGWFVRNPDYRDGQATSLAAAFHEVSDASEAAVVLMADQPGITADDIRALIDRFLATRKRIVRLRFIDGPGPALLSREVYAEAGHLRGDVGARVLIASNPDWVEEISIDRPTPPDIDSPGDLSA
jgi:molybdenum cofactor cytidylyltransferase